MIEESRHNANIKINNGETIKIENEKTTNIDFTLKPGGYRLSGSLRNLQGSPVQGRVACYRFDEDEENTFFAECQENRFAITLPKGHYYLIVQAPDYAKIREVLNLEAPQTDKQITLEPGPCPAPDTVKTWIKANAIPLTTVEAGHGFADMLPLKKVVGNSRLVCLGDATYGSHEFFQLRHRMLEFLVENMGFTVFAIAANMPEVYAVNEYVLEGKGDPAKALADFHYWTWNTEEMLEMIGWMRRYNENPAHTRKVKFYGIDMQYTELPYAKTKAYLDKVDPAGAAWLTQHLSVFASNKFLDEKLSAEQKQIWLKDTFELLSRFDAHRADYIKASSIAEFALMRQYVRICSQSMEMESAENMVISNSVRDQKMAENMLWIMEQEGPQAKAVFWDHNMQIELGLSWDGVFPIGTYLKKSLGNSMVVFGFVFNQGGFRSSEMPPQSRGVVSFKVKPDPKETLGLALASTGFPVLALDLRQLPSAGPVKSWFSGFQGVWEAGTMFSLDWAKGRCGSIKALQRFDALLFVEKTTASRPNMIIWNAKVNLSKSDEDKAVPENMDFEAGEPGQMPPGWHFPVNPVFSGYLAQLSGEGAQQGRHCLKVWFPGQPTEGAWATLLQSLDAKPYRGKKVRLTGWIKSSPGTKAMLWLKVKREFHVGLCDDMKNRPVTATSWTMAQIEGRVDDDALRLNFGCMLLGVGPAYFDAIKIEVIQ
jgi:erythromycin esterase